MTETRPNQEITQYLPYAEGIRHSMANVRSPWVLRSAIRAQTGVFFHYGGKDLLERRGHTLLIVGSEKFPLSNYKPKMKNPNIARFEELERQILDAQPATET